MDTGTKTEKKCCSNVHYENLFYFLNHVNVFQESPKIAKYNMGTLKLK